MKRVSKSSYLKYVKSSVFNILVTIAAGVGQFVLVLLLAQHMTAEEYSQLGIVLLVVGIGALYQDWGLNNHVLVSDFEVNVYFKKYLSIAFVNFFLNIVLVFISFKLYEISNIVLCTVLPFYMTLNSIYSYYFVTIQKNLRFNILSITEIISLLVIGGSLVFFIGYYSPLDAYIFAMTIGLLTKTALSGLLLSRFSDVNVYTRASLPRNEGKFRVNSRFQLFERIIVFLSNKGDQVILSLGLDAGSLGLYMFVSNILGQVRNRLSPPVLKVLLPIMMAKNIKNDFYSLVYMSLLALGTLLIFCVRFYGAAAFNFIGIHYAGLTDLFEFFALFFVIMSVMDITNNKLISVEDFKGSLNWSIVKALTILFVSFGVFVFTLQVTAYIMTAGAFFLMFLDNWKFGKYNINRELVFFVVLLFILNLISSMFRLDIVFFLIIAGITVIKLYSVYIRFSDGNYFS